ncbi:PKD domain-containing protein [Arsenicibacter rosenii]|nr:PKD domain-containing protein [Arsenicibacter rosenii]
MLLLATILLAGSTKAAARKLTSFPADPVVSVTAVASPLVVTVGQIVNLSAETPDGLEVDYLWTGPSGALIDEPTFGGTFATMTSPGIQTFTVTVDDLQGGTATSTVSVTVLAPELCPSPTASNLQVVGTLGRDKCSIQLSALVSGRHFEFTGPNGYVYSVIYRSCQENITIFAENVKEPGTYTLKIYQEEVVSGPIPGRRAAGDGQYYTIDVGGAACPNP